LTDSRLVHGDARTAAETQIERLLALDALAWEQLYDQYFRGLRNFAYARTGSLEAAEDIASEVFAAAVKGIRTYRHRGAPIGAWLYRIARNLTADQVDRRRRRPQVPLEETREPEAPAGSLLQVEERDDLLRGMARLTREQQELIALRFFSDCSLEDTARAMSKSIGAVKVLQHRALASLRRQMTLKEPR
jgi:RNA polymerase sigma-70 factor (ECF subfamily)